MNYPQNRIFIYSLLTAVIVLLCIVLFRGCGTPQPPTASRIINTDSIKAELRKEFEAIAVLNKTSKTTQDTAIKYVDRWHKAKHDTLPCEEKLPIIIQVCDTAITKLQQANVAVNTELTQAYKIIGTQSGVIKIDSLNFATLNDSIKGLNKKVRRQKFWLKVVSITAVGCLGAAVAR